MDGQALAALERFDNDDIEVRFPGLHLTSPCTAQGISGDDSSSPTSYCDLLDRLSVWNRVIWHLGLQLREVTAPGELSLVRIEHGGRGGQQELRGRDARLLFHALLAQHRCVVSADLHETLVEGSGLGECRELVVSALRRNASLWALNLASLFCSYRFVQEDVLAVIATITGLQQLVISATTEAPACLVNALRSLLDTTSLSTLSLLGLSFDAKSAKLLVNALRRNHTIADLSVHSSILCSRLPKNVARFSLYIASSFRLRALRVEGVHSEPEQTRNELKDIAAPVGVRGTLVELYLSGFLLDSNCAWLFSRLVASTGGALRHLDISGCRWRSEPLLSSQDAGKDCGKLATGSSEPVHAWLNAFDDFTQVRLSSFSLSLAGLRPDACKALIGATAILESLRTVSVSDVALDELPEVCKAIRDAGVSDRVQIKGEYLLDSATLAALEDFREEVRHVAVSSLKEPSVGAFRETVRQVCSWYHVTTLRLFLSQEAIGDVRTMRSLCNYLNVATLLRELSLKGCDKPDLSGCLPAEVPTHSLLLKAILTSQSLRRLQVSRFRLGAGNLRLLLDTVITSKTLVELDFSSCHSSENNCLLSVLADNFDRNKTMLRLRVSGPLSAEREADRAVIEAVLGRNVGFVTCAAHFMVGEVHTSRCVEALVCASTSPALFEKVHGLAPTSTVEPASFVLSV